MQSSAGLRNPRLRSQLLLAAVPLAALAVSLMLAFVVASAPRPEANADAGAPARVMTVEPRIAVPVAAPLAMSTPAGGDAKPGTDAGRPPSMGALLAPWAFAVDVLAVLGIAVVLTVRYRARRRRGARR
ncbi:MAG TPA: hypothetical protein VIJ64_05425 [Candidatus Lustribacter sp.]